VSEQTAGTFDAACPQGELPPPEGEGGAYEGLAKQSLCRRAALL